MSEFNAHYEDQQRAILSPEILKVQNLTKYYEQVKAVENLSFSIKRGEIYGLLGPNGAGKTTTIKSILGLLTLNYGSISLLGYDPIREPQIVKSKIGYVAEEPLIYGSMTPGELFNFIASIRGLDPRTTTQRVNQFVQSLDCQQYYYNVVESLSRGNKQKIQIIAALLHEPDLLILDEPLSGLDAKSRKIVKNLFELHIESGKSILLSTHSMEDAQQLCTRIGIINRGQLIAEGSIEELQKISASTGSRLEEIFLKLTEQNESVEEITTKLRESFLNRRL